MSAEGTSRADERFLVTGAYGCIGAWAVHHLVSEGVPVVTLDPGERVHRLRMLLSDDELASIPHARVDVTDLDLLERTIDEHGITNVIHLAALQVPFCRADPPLGARVNVVGTVNVFEAVARRRDRMGPVVYASSVAAYEALDRLEGGAPSPTAGIPSTLYGVYKRANEGTADVYWRDHGLASVGLRPHTVYGLGRDQGLTSAPTAAMFAAARGEAFRIPYGGSAQMQYAPDVARAFIMASRRPVEGAGVHDLPGPAVHMSEIVEAIELAAPEAAGLISYDDVSLMFPERVDSSSFVDLLGSFADTPLRAGVAETITRYRQLIAEGRTPDPAPDVPLPR